MAPQFVDISSFQGTIDWVAYRTWAAQWDGIARVAMKATEGVGFTDPQFGANRARALAAGIDSIIFYHFARPDLGNTPLAEANWFYSVVGSIRSKDRIFLDYEVESSLATAQWSLAWLVEFGPWYGKLPGIYASFDYILDHLQWPGLNAFPLWLADWTGSPDARPPCPPPWTACEAIQYTDKATNIPGIQGNVDGDVFIGGQNVNQYGPNSADFATWFTVDTNGNWVCKAYNNPVIMGGNKTLYALISLDGNTLPIIGLPRTNELYQTDSDGYTWSVQFFERGLIVYDPQHRQDSQPGLGASYLGKYLQFLHLDPDYTPIIRIPDAVMQGINNIQDACTQLAKAVAGQ